MSRNTIAMALLGLVFIAALALPVSAAQADGNTAGKASKIDPQLKNALWANHQEYRLRQFDLNVQRADSVITILDKYGIDTTKPQATLTTISGQRADLEKALEGRDRDSLKTINANLMSLWKQFAQEVRESVKEHYQAGNAGGKGSSTGSMDGAGEDSLMAAATVTL
ncbi:MAG TPA: hypothetical protein VMT31_08915 [Methanomicrobiales archaeon]|nr:hypothetical protein [Methanomicrobiales archaeon]